MLEHAPMIILLVHARSFIYQQPKYISIRQYHIHINIKNITKKRMYPIIYLMCTISSNWSSRYFSRGCGCNYGSHVLIILPFLKTKPSSALLNLKCGYQKRQGVHVVHIYVIHSYFPQFLEI